MKALKKVLSKAIKEPKWCGGGVSEKEMKREMESPAGSNLSQNRAVRTLPRSEATSSSLMVWTTKYRTVQGWEEPNGLVQII